MGGVNVYCGTFIGRDKSGTLFQEVLADIAHASGSNVRDVIKRINESIEFSNDYILIESDDASALINDMTAQIDRYDLNQQNDRQKVCAEDLLKACQISVAEGEPIALVW